MIVSYKSLKFYKMDPCLVVEVAKRANNKLPFLYPSVSNLPFPPFSAKFNELKASSEFRGPGGGGGGGRSLCTAEAEKPPVFEINFQSRKLDPDQGVPLRKISIIIRLQLLKDAELSQKGVHSGLLIPIEENAVESSIYC